jgi:hypothetical protein
VKIITKMLRHKDKWQTIHKREVHSNMEKTEEIGARDLEKITFYLSRSPLSGLGCGTRNPGTLPRLPRLSSSYGSHWTDV